MQASSQTCKQQERCTTPRVLIYQACFSRFLRLSFVNSRYRLRSDTSAVKIGFRDAILISSPDLVLAARGQKNRGGGRGRERRKRDLAKYESKRVLIGCSITVVKAHACVISFARSAKNTPKKFYRTKKKISRLCLTQQNTIKCI